MKLFFDARFIRTDWHDSISLYSASLAGEILKWHDDVTFLICDEEQAEFLPEGAKTVKIHAPDSLREVRSGRVIEGLGADVVWTPLQTVGSSRAYRLILTIHDLTYFKFNTPPDGKKWWVRLGWKLFHMTYLPQRMILRKADAVMVPSEETRRELLEAKMFEGDIEVVSPAPRKLSDVRERPAQGEDAPRNIVYIGTGQRHKNVGVLVRGMEFLPGRVLHLMSPMSEKVRRSLLAAKPEGAEIVFHGGFDAEKQAEVLADDAILVSASLAEGFGIPLVEAMEFGVPIVVANTAVFREVAGDAAEFFDPFSPQDFARAVEVMDTKVVRERIVTKGLEQAKKFNWRESAKVITETARRLYGER
ncbi:glycosyltransferase family 4 protein [Candidatus Saccharibacteria bacterium]|nr:glycosyltransferase family 4 protein [Candidatus Saccharibacteria bacterium]